MFASNYTSLPAKHEFSVVKELKQKNLIPENSVFIPGFSGDMLGGSLLPHSYFFGEDEKRHTMETDRI